MLSRAYFDHNATTVLRPEARDAMLQAAETLGNPSSLHAEGQAAEAILEDARDRVAAALGAEPLDVVFTSGGTEANNLAVAAMLPKTGGKETRLVTSVVEHPSVLRCCQAYEQRGVSLAVVGCDPDGRVSPQALKDALSTDTVLVSIQHGNSVTGVVQDIDALAAVAHEAGVPFHTDAVQSVGRLPIRFNEMRVDMLSLSGHKIGAPRGIGVLLTHQRSEMTPLLYGGNQERGRRAGTENLCGIAGLAAAIEIAVDEQETLREQWAAYRAELIEDMRNIYPDVLVNGEEGLLLENTLNVSFPGISGEDLMMSLDMAGIAVSTGTACSLRAPGPSSTLKAMGLEKARLCSAIRVSMGWATTEDDIDALLERLPAALRASSEGEDV